MDNEERGKLLQDKLARWHTVKATLAPLVEEETNLRKEIFELAYPNKPEKGSHRHAIGYGKDLKATAKLNYSIDKAKLAEAIEAGKLPADVVSSVFKQTPSVSETAFLAVKDKKILAVLSDIITSKPGLPSLEIVDVKKGV